MMRNRYVRSEIVWLVITVIIAIGLTYGDPSRWLSNLISSLIFSHCIGISISTLIRLLEKRIWRLRLIPRLGALFVVFVVGGSIGTGVGILIHHYVFGTTLESATLSRLLLFNLLLAAIFGSAIVVYFSLKSTAERMAERLREKEVNEEKLIRLKTQAELEALQAKINPHFLFNTLNSIASLISENPAQAESIVEKLSGLFRYTLQRTGNVKLSEELEIVRSYLEIEGIRFGSRLTFEIKADHRLNDFEIPALLIQPLVENSIKHGISSEVQGGTIQVETVASGNQCVISVTDSGKGFTDTTEETGFGLKSIRERLRLTYGERASLQIGHDGSTRIQISIPLS